MESLRELYRMGVGPSSSHTMGPRNAAEIFKNHNPTATEFRVILYGSLAATGKGHLTDKAITSVLNPLKNRIIWKPKSFLSLHPNGMDFSAYKENKLLSKWRVFSIGGGALKDEHTQKNYYSPYHLKNMDQILEWTEKEKKSLWEYVLESEPNIEKYLEEVWRVMQDSIRRGIEQEGLLPGSLKLSRKASSYYIKSKNSTGALKENSLVFAYALAVAEENAAGGEIVTAPTCGSCGILPAVLLSLQKTYNFPNSKIIRALATAGLIGNVVKKNGSISGAEVGCQGEVGTACAMAAGAAAQLLGGNNYQIEYAAEMGLEHHLGLTCDPIAGLVQIPCIERNALAAVRALDCASFSLLSDGRHRISFDSVIKTMLETGHDLKKKYRETSLGGLAKNIKKKELNFNKKRVI